jgi:Mn2+/Fe2+ NRAMP family transporter
LKRAVTVIGPGLLVAATGIGAGDLATASFAGSHLGTAVLWAALAGAFLKFVVNEGLARWQLATGTTLLEGVVRHFGRWAGWAFLAYLLFWSFFVASALMSACGVTLHAMIPLFEDASDGKVVFGILSSLAGAALVLRGGYPLFSKIMQVCIGLMFVTVVVTASILWPGTEVVLRGLFLPSIPNPESGGLSWTVALMGGIGGTVTVLCYGYWMREDKRAGWDDLRICRLDLVTAYLVTAVFGIAMVIIGSTVEIEGRGASLLVTLSDRLVGSLGTVGRWVFLAGALGAVFSSLLGVWQAVPYLFADLWGLLRQPDSKEEVESRVNTRSMAYRVYLAALALLPMVGLFYGFRDVQKIYAVVGAWFFPFLALALLLLNGRSAWVGRTHRNRPVTVAVLVGVLGFFSWIAWQA